MTKNLWLCKTTAGKDAASSSIHGPALSMAGFIGRVCLHHNCRLFVSTLLHFVGFVVSWSTHRLTGSKARMWCMVVCFLSWFVRTGDRQHHRQHLHRQQGKSNQCDLQERLQRHSFRELEACAIRPPGHQPCDLRVIIYRQGPRVLAVLLPPPVLSALSRGLTTSGPSLFRVWIACRGHK